jgi:hypothetical protein
MKSQARSNGGDDKTVRGCSGPLSAGFGTACQKEEDLRDGWPGDVNPRRSKQPY